MSNSIYFPVWIRIMDAIYRGNNIGHKIAKEEYITYSQTNKIITELEKKGILQKHKKGRTKHLILTTKGKNLAKNCYELIHNIK